MLAQMSYPILQLQSHQSELEFLRLALLFALLQFRMQAGPSNADAPACTPPAPSCAVQPLTQSSKPFERPGSRLGSD